MLPINLPDSTNTYPWFYQYLSLILPIPIPDSTNTYPWFYQYLSLILPLHIPDTTTIYPCDHYYLNLMRDLKLALISVNSKIKYLTSQLIPVNIENAGPDL